MTATIVNQKVLADSRWFCLAGVGISHSLAPVVHNAVTQSLGLPWTFKLLECPNIEFLISAFRQPNFAAGVVTMPYKKTIIPYLDEVDERVKMLGSCNNVYLKQSEDGTGRVNLCGSNTDWIGILECLKGKSTKGMGKPALVIGAGGASRAAIYALYKHLNCKTIYIINRDEKEVEDLQQDVKSYGTESPCIIHVRTMEQATSLSSPWYVVGTVPDFEPETSSEITVYAMVRHLLEKATEDSEGERGILLDMCFNPRQTRFIKLATSLNWTTIEGYKIIGWQVHEQYRLWTGQDVSKTLNTAHIWNLLDSAAEASPIINRP